MGSTGLRLAIIALLAGAAPAAGQVANTSRWIAHADATFERLDGSDVLGSDWIELRAGVGRRLTGGRVVLEGMRVRRFADWDAAGAAEAYHTLWRGAYGNVRVQVAPEATVLPRADVSAELFQGVGQGVEVSVGYRRMQFEGFGVDIRRLGLASNLQGWYLRGIVSVVPHDGDTTATSLGATVRRLSRDELSFVEVSGAFGTESVTIAPGPVVELRDTRSILLRGQYALSRRLRATASLGYAEQDNFPDRIGGSLGLRID